MRRGTPLSRLTSRGEVGLVGVAGFGGDGGERDAGAGQAQGALEADDALQGLRGVAEGGQAAAVELAFAEAEVAGHR